MRRRTLLATVCTVWIVASSPSVPAQDDPTGGRVRARAVRVTSDPVLDGDVLNDPAWADAVPATGFIQNTPDEGKSATERTEVFVTFNDDTLFVGVVCYDRQPGGIIVAHARRDESLDETDSFQLILDTYPEKRCQRILGRPEKHPVRESSG